MTTERIQRILVPTDLSSFSKSAAAWAAMFHRHFDSRITLLYADEPYVPFDILEGPAAHVLQTQPEFRMRLFGELEKFSAECFPHDESFVEAVIVDGAPAQASIDTVNEIDADVILMGTHGRRGWRRMLLGSVTEQVVRATDRPLLSVRASATPGGPEGREDSLSGQLHRDRASGARRGSCPRGGVRRRSADRPCRRAQTLFRHDHHRDDDRAGGAIRQAARLDRRLTNCCKQGDSPCERNTFRPRTGGKHSIR